MSQVPAPPPGAAPAVPTAAAGAGNMNGWWLNAEPLPEAVNAFQFTAALLPEHEQARKDWLIYLSKRIDFRSNEPIILMAMGRCALNLQLRTSWDGAIKGIEQAIAEARKVG